MSSATPFSITTSVAPSGVAVKGSIRQSEHPRFTKRRQEMLTQHGAIALRLHVMGGGRDEFADFQ